MEELAPYHQENGMRFFALKNKDSLRIGRAGPEHYFSLHMLSSYGG